MSRPAEPNDACPPGLLEKILGELKHSVRKEHFETWFRGITLRTVQGERYVFGVPSGFVRDWLRKNYQALIESAIRAATGLRRCEVVLQLAREQEPRTATALDERSVRDFEDGSGTEGPQVPGPQVPGPHELESQIDERRPGETGTSEPARSAHRPGEPHGPNGRDDWRDGTERGFQPIRKPPQSTDRDGSRQHDDGQGAGQPGFGLPGQGGSGAKASDERLSSERSRFGNGRYSGTNWDRLADLGDLNRSYTFDQFVVGPCNRLSHAAALAVAENPGRAYNPLFIHGNVGLGKTHLLQAICHEIRRKDERARALYLSCEEFTNRFIHAIQAGRLDEFRELHRSVDVLVIDDIQFLANKDKTQDEFFHTFNALYNTNRQIIISSDRSPSDIPTIEERLVSRFRWGFVAEMEVPCFETRVAIARRKARLRQLELPEDVAYFIAERIDTNIRELEGAVVKVVGVASITDREVSVELAEEALRGVIVQRSRQVSVSEIMGLVTEEFSITARDMIGKSRTQAISLPRQICMYLCRQLTEQSLEEIGRYFGGRDHTTVLYAVKKIEKRVKDDRMFRELVGTLNTRLHN